MTRTKFISALCIIGLTSVLYACGVLDGSSNVSVKTKLVSSSLSGSRNLGADRTLETTGCGGTFVACITPDTVTGKAYYAGMIVGGGEASSQGLSLGPMIGEVVDPSKASAFEDSELIAFDFSQQLVLNGSPSLGGPIPYPDDAGAFITQFHVYFGYVDTTITLENGEGQPGIHVIRQVMADVTGTELKKGDLLYHADGATDFKWCVSGAGCTEATRPTTPVVNSTIATFSQTNEGNKTIPSFFMLPTSSTIQVKKSDLENKANTNNFTVDISMTKGIKFTTEPINWVTLDQMVAAFRLPADPGDSTAGFTAAITYTP